MSEPQSLLAVEPRECQDCLHSRKLHEGYFAWICRKHLMAITATMHVTYKVAEGSCWTPREERQRYDPNTGVGVPP